MTQDNVVKLIQPAEFSDPLTEVLREGARALLAQAVEAEVAAFLGSHADKQTEDGRQRLVRHGEVSGRRWNRSPPAARPPCPPAHRPVMGLAECFALSKA